ncbi:MAG: MBOAT family protein, partial [Clostridia bacterium]|nr:MBOAT family protein [Clostridia bacterium]
MTFDLLRENALTYIKKSGEIMVFSSLLFVFLFLSFNLLSQIVLKKTEYKNAAMLAFSILFYCWAGPVYFLLLLFDVFVCWGAARLIENADKTDRKILLAFAVFAVLLVLGIFKYTGFVSGTLQSIFGFPSETISIALPVGISFYSFQLISYVADVYRGQVAAQKKFWVLLLYACLFHQCIAGPIVRYSDVEKDILTRRVNRAEISRGISRFTVGLAKKAVLANSCAAVADLFFDKTAGDLAKTPALGLWLAGFAFMLQIYLDFSAYSDMAIGMGLMCGFHYRENFNYPYTADSVTDFWRRWHISLSTFFRDYVYIPLGGNRKGTARQIFNLFVVWGLTGLWHGASWNYVIWGLYFFVFLTIEKFVLGKKLERIPKAVRIFFVLVIVYFCWIIFKFEDFASLGTVLRGLFGLNHNSFGGKAVTLAFKSN